MLSTSSAWLRSPGAFSSVPAAARWLRWARHAGLWVGMLAFECALLLAQPAPPLLLLTFLARDLLAAMAGFYFFSYFVLPRLVLRRRWLLTGLSLLAIYYAWALLGHVLFAGLVGAGVPLGEWSSYIHRSLDRGVWVGVFAWYGVSMGLSDFIAVPLQPILLRFLWFLLRSSNQTLRLQRENLELEISFLKAQINPHFLFNTLNNLYTMLLKQDERAPAVVVHLTDLMRYTVQESDAATVPLRRELEFLADYLALERLRYGQQVRISYQPPGPVAGRVIVPLLLFPFLENAFKHGADSSVAAGWVDIAIRVTGPRLELRVRNSYRPAAPPRAHGGVGLANVRQRLALHYPGAASQLLLRQTADTYEVTLTLELAF